MNFIEEDKVSFETAILLKEIQFNIPVNSFYDLYDNPNNTKLSHSSKDNWNNYKSLSAPTQSLAQKWLREVYNTRVIIDFETIDDAETAYTYQICYDLPEGKGRKKNDCDFYERIYSFNQGGGWYKTYEEALELGLKEACLILKKK